MDSQESHNYFKLVHIVLNNVSEVMRTVFKVEWDVLYPAVPWNDDPSSLREFNRLETPSPRNRNNYTNLQKTLGDRSKWDVTLLCYTILYSKPVGLGGRSTKRVEASAVDNLRQIRNEVLHKEIAEITDADFKRIYKDIKSEIRKFGATCHAHLVEVKSVKRKPLPKSEKERLLTELEKEKEKFRKEQLQKLIVTASFVVVTLALGLVSVLSYEYSVVPSSPSFFPEDRVPPGFVGRTSEMKQAIRAIDEGKRLIVLYGLPGVGKKSTSLVIGKTLRERWLPFPWLNMCYVDLCGTNSVVSIQRRILQSFFISTNVVDEQVPLLLRNFLKNFIKRKTVVIIDRTYGIEIIKLKHVINEVLTMNTNIVAMVNLPEPVYLSNFETVGILIKTLSTEDSFDALHGRIPDISDSDLQSIAHSCDGLPLCLHMFSSLLKNGYDIHKISVMHETLGKFRVNLRFVHVLLDILDGNLRNTLLLSTVLRSKFSEEDIHSLVTEGESFQTLVSMEIITKSRDTENSLVFETHHVFVQYSKEYLKDGLNYFHTKYHLTVCQRYAQNFVTFWNWNTSALRVVERRILDPEFSLWTLNTGDNGYYFLDYFAPDLLEAHANTFLIAGSAFLFDILGPVLSADQYYIETTAATGSRFIRLVNAQGEHGDVYQFLYHDMYIHDNLPSIIDDRRDSLNEEECSGMDDVEEKAICLLVTGRASVSRSWFGRSAHFAGETPDIAASLPLINKAGQLFSDSGNKVYQAEALSTEGLILVMAGLYEQGREKYLAALDILRDLYDCHPYLAASYFNVGHTYLKQGGLYMLLASEWFQKSYDMYLRTLGIHHRTVKSLTCLWLTFYSLGKFKAATDAVFGQYQMLRKLEQQTSDPKKMKVYKQERFYIETRSQEFQPNLDWCPCPAEICKVDETLKDVFTALYEGNCYKSFDQTETARERFNQAQSKLFDMCEHNQDFCALYESLGRDLAAESHVTEVTDNLHVETVLSEYTQPSEIWSKVNSLDFSYFVSVIASFIAVLFVCRY